MAAIPRPSMMRAMLYTTTISGAFSSKHQIPGHPLCAHDHGHRWKVDVTIGGRYEARTGQVLDSVALGDEFSALMAELHLKPLNDMLPGVITTPHGIATWIMERLLLNWSVQAVSVSEEPGSTATVVREV